MYIKIKAVKPIMKLLPCHADDSYAINADYPALSLFVWLLHRKIGINTPTDPYYRYGWNLPNIHGYSI